MLATQVAASLADALGGARRCSGRRVAPGSARSTSSSSTPRRRARVDHPPLRAHGRPLHRRLMAWVCEEGHCDEAMRDKDWIDFNDLVDRGQESVESGRRRRRPSPA